MKKKIFFRVILVGFLSFLIIFAASIFFKINFFEAIKLAMTKKYYVKIEKNGKHIFSHFDQKTNIFNTEEISAETDIPKMMKKYDCQKWMEGSQRYSNCNHRFYYEVDAYGKEGDLLKTRFTSSKNLKVGSFIQLYLSSVNKDQIQDTTYTWEEVSYHQLPQNIKTIFQKNH